MVTIKKAVYQASEEGLFQVNSHRGPEYGDIKNQIVEFHQVQNSRDRGELNNGESSSIKNSRNGDMLKKQSKALHTSIRRCHEPTILKQIKSIQILMILFIASLTIASYTSNRRLFSDVDNLVSIVRESENRQAGVMDLYRRSVTIRNFVTGFGSPFRNLTQPALHQINNYVVFLRPRTKNFLISQFFLKDALNNRNQRDILELEEREFDVWMYDEQGNRKLQKIDIFQFAKLLAEAVIFNLIQFNTFLRGKSWYF